jgi:hypothetical protein
VQPVVGDELAQARTSGRKRSEQLTQRCRIDLEFGDARTLAWNTQEFDVHDVLVAAPAAPMPERRRRVT